MQYASLLTRSDTAFPVQSALRYVQIQLFKHTHAPMEVLWDLFLSCPKTLWHTAGARDGTTDLLTSGQICSSSRSHSFPTSLWLYDHAILKHLCNVMGNSHIQFTALNLTEYCELLQVLSLYSGYFCWITLLSQERIDAYQRQALEGHGFVL